MINTIKNEPVMTATIAPIAAAVMGLLVAFGVDLTPEQQQAVTTAVLVITPFVMMAANWLARARVTPVHKLADADAPFRPGQPGNK